MEADIRRGDWPANPVIYQIYPRSFQDTTGSGEGDLTGITQRLEHVARLGVDAVWLSPFFVSPLCDGGYDVADHMDVDPRFGTLADFDALVAQAHQLGLKVIIDQVFNHTSDTHPWFAASLSRTPGFEDFYVWADPAPDGSPPSNWIGYFGHPAWRWHPQRAQYCLHQFLPCQPGLNHRNPKVHAALRSITEFWRARGVDGFRFDAITSFFHDPAFRDNPPAGPVQKRIPGAPGNPFTLQRHVHDMLPDDCAAFARDIRNWAGDESYLFGEINKGPRSVELTKAFTGDHGLDAGYIVDLAERGLTGLILEDVITRLDRPGRLAWWLSSHDQKRQVSRAGDGSPRDARMLAALLLALPGPVLLYQGEELGMVQAKLPLNRLKDPYDRAYWPEPPGRDGARTPMAWQENAPGYGFTKSDPWLPVVPPPDGAVERQGMTDGSVLKFYQNALGKRRSLALADGSVEVLAAKDTFFAARLTAGSKGFVLALNLGLAEHALPQEAGDIFLSSAAQPHAGQIAPRSTVWCTSRQ